MRTLTAALTAFLLVLTTLLYSQNDFKIGFSGAYPIQWDISAYNYTLQHTDWSWYSDLNVNLWSGWNIDGRHTGAITQLESNSLNAYFQPDTMIYHAALGRISIFEAEDDYFGRHRYTDHHGMGIPVEDIWAGETQKAQYYDANGTTYDPPVLVLNRIDESCEQVLSGIPSQFVTNTQDPNLKWYVKPRMRIPTLAALDPPLPVVKLVIKAFNSSVVREIVINTNDFRDTNSNTYDGRYLEEFFGLPIAVLGDELRIGTPPDYPSTLSSSGVDYEIYWYGKVDVWIDYVKVMDNTAHDLFNPNDSKIRDAIQREMNNLLNFDSLKGFYTEEVQYSNLRCLKFIQKLLRQYSHNDPRARLVCLINPPTYRHSLSDSWNPDNIQIYEAYADSVDPPAFIFAGYPWEYYFIPSKLPNTLAPFTFHHTYTQQTKDTINSYYGSIKVDPPIYNAHIQSVWDRYKTELKKYSTIAHSRGQGFYVNTGIQGFRINGIDYAREPMMSELNSAYGMALCYGATGILQYAFESWISEDATKTHFNFGMLDEFTLPITGQILMIEKRDRNLYGENKWDEMVNLHSKLKKWGVIAANSPLTKGYSVAIEGSNHEFIENFVSIVPHLSGQNPCVTDGTSIDEFADCPEESYWEMGFFGAPASERNTKYFMLVNRRCVPENDSHFTPDNRFVKIKFNAASLPGSWKNWQLSEVGGSARPINFSRNGGYVNLGTTPGSMGWFKPGDGKLFKITPTSETGGDLVCDEVITGESFTCEDTIFNNGYNITISAGTNMKFTDSSCIVMNGGVFTMGNQQVSGSQNITFDAASGNSWRGHSFTGTEVHIYGASFSGLANDSIYALNMIDCPVVDIRGTRV